MSEGLEVMFESQFVYEDVGINFNAYQNEIKVKYMLGG